MITIYDLKKDSTGLLFFKEGLEELTASKDQHKREWININLDNYDCFTIATIKDQTRETFVAWSGMYSKIYPDGYCRIGQRYYKSKNFRLNILTSKEDQIESLHTGIKYMLPYQIEIAKKLDKKVIIVTMNYNRKRYFKRFVNRLNSSLTGLDYNDFVIQEDLYHTCRTYKNDKYIGLNKSPMCWQYIATLNLTGDTLEPIPSITKEEYIERFKSS